MDKRHQVFVSSTYEDLRVERQRVIQILLEFDCIPVGMELFPAGDESQWKVIEKVIDECDYYVVIVAGRYGTVDADGKSYTQREYEYAVRKGIPVMAFLHGEPGKISQQQSEQTVEGKAKLEEFRKLCRQKICKEWRSADELASAVLTSVNHAKKTNQRIGWVRANQLASESVTSELVQVRRENDDLRAQLAQIAQNPPAGTGELSQGDDTFAIRFTIARAVPRGGGATMGKVSDVWSSSWNHLLSLLGPGLMLHLSEHGFDYRIREAITGEGSPDLAQRYDLPLRDVEVSKVDIETIVIQFGALGIIELANEASKTHGELRWKLTAYGNRLLTNIRAIKKSQSQKAI